MTLAIWTLAILMLITVVIGFIDICKEIKSFSRSGVVSGAGFEREGTGRGTTFRLPMDDPPRPVLTSMIKKNAFPLKINSHGLQAAPTISTISKSEGNTL